MTLPQAFFIVLAFILLIYVLLNEKRSKSQVPFLIRCLAGLLAIGALSGLFFPLKYPQSWHTSDKSDELVVFTKGTPDSTIRIATKNGNTATTDSAIARQHLIPLIQNWEAFLRQHPRVPIALYGFGLTRPQLDALTDRPLHYHAPQPPQGFVFCAWPLQLQALSPLVAQGQYNNPSDQEVKVVLLSANQPVDSTIIPARAAHAFTLSCLPKQLGNTLFNVLAIAGQDTLQHEKLPVFINPPQTLNVVMLAASPSFEYKFLGNWFQQLRYGIASRARISVDKFSFTYSEGSPLSLAPPLDASTFKQADLLIADEAELAMCTQTEQQAIAAAVRSGMGLLLFVGDEKKHSLLGQEFRVATTSNEHEQTIAIKSITKQDYPQLPIVLLNGIQVKPSQQPLLYHDTQIVAASQLYGKGFVTAMTINNSYSWWLRDQQEAYTRLWSFLLDNTTAGRQQALHYVQTPHFPTTHNWMELLLQHPEPLLSIDGQPHPVLQHEYLPELSKLSFWPQHGGWHSITAQQADSAWFYVYDQTDWQPARDFATLGATKAFATREHEKLTNKPEIEVNPENEIPKWIFFLLFLIAATVLWYASRQYNQNVM